MSKERELLKQVVENFAYVQDMHLIVAIQKLLNQPEQTEQEPVAWMYDWTNEIGELIKGVYVGSHKASHLYELENLQPLYLAPPKREPIEDEELEVWYSQHAWAMDKQEYMWGFRDAEKAHGIGGGE